MVFSNSENENPKHIYYKGNYVYFQIFVTFSPQNHLIKQNTQNHGFS
jgi:hypothetical protein